jgi:Tol biopolymer transport system component
MEGKGPFAYYDFEAQKYVGWDKALGLYDWSPDSSFLAYDYMVYTATGTERIFLRSREGAEENQLSPDAQGYAFYPAISPDGNQVAYLAGSSNLDSQSYILTVQSIQGGEPRELGVFESVMGLEWSPDGKNLIFSAGPYEAQQVYSVSIEDGSATVLAQGGQPSLAGK